MATLWSVGGEGSRGEGQGAEGGHALVAGGQVVELEQLAEGGHARVAQYPIFFVVPSA